jgi:hypothetical protein
MDLAGDLKVFLEIEKGLAGCPDDMVEFDDAITEEDILARLEMAESGDAETTADWHAAVVRCRSAYLYAAFTFYGTDAKLRACQAAKVALKELIVLFRGKRLSIARFERRLGHIREAMQVAKERGFVE